MNCHQILHEYHYSLYSRNEFNTGVSVCITHFRRNLLYFKITLRKLASGYMISIVQEKKKKKTKKINKTTTKYELTAAANYRKK